MPQVFLVLNGSNASTVCLMMVLFMLSICTCLNTLATASRQAWALNCDQALPFSPWFCKVCCIRFRRLLTANIALDHSHRNPRPNQQHHHLTLSPDRHCIDQHRFECSTQHSRCTPHQGYKLQLRSQNRLHSVQTPARREYVACTLVAWEIRNNDRCLCDCIRDRFCHGFVFPHH